MTIVEDTTDGKTETEKERKVFGSADSYVKSIAIQLQSINGHTQEVELHYVCKVCIFLLLKSTKRCRIQYVQPSVRNEYVSVGIEKFQSNS